MPMLHFDLDELFEDLILEEKSKKQNATDTAHKEKIDGVGGEVPQAQQPHGFATPPNNSTESTISTKWVEKHTLEEHLSDLTEIEQLQLLIEDHWRKRLPGSFHVPIGYDIEVLHQRMEQKLDIWWGKEPGTQPMGIMIDQANAVVAAIRQHRGDHAADLSGAQHDNRKRPRRGGQVTHGGGTQRGKLHGGLRQ